MSVMFAPRARREVNASWPGVSMNVMGCPLDIDLVGADVLGDPPLFPSTTLVLRIESRRVVFPWSTCPITVTTGGRGASSDSASSNTGRSATAGRGGALDVDYEPE